MKTKAIFVDTNIWVYLRSQTSPFHQPATAMMAALSQAQYWVSHQVLREYLVTMARGVYTNQIPKANELMSDIDAITAKTQVALEGSGSFEYLRKLILEHPAAINRVHDAHLVATMLANGIGSLLTNNTKDFTAYSDLIEIIPLLPPATP